MGDGKTLVNNLPFISSGNGILVDDTLSISSAAADAKVTGEALAGKLDNTPGTWPAWTADEQAAARERMGVENGGDFELLVDATLEEEANTFTVQFPKTVRELIYHIWFFNNNGENVIAQTKCLNAKGDRYYLIKYASGIKAGNGFAQNGYLRYNGNIIGYAVIGFASDSQSSSWTTDTNGNGNAAYTNYPTSLDLTEVGGIKFYLNNASHVLNAGAVIKVWGR